MIVDCDRCQVRGQACGDCAIGVLLGMPAVPPAEEPAPGIVLPPGAPPLQLAPAERRALAVLADQGLLPRLRVVPGEVRRDAV